MCKNIPTFETKTLKIDGKTELKWPELIDNSLI